MNDKNTPSEEIDPANRETETALDDATCSHLFNVGDVVKHKTSGQVGVIRKCHRGPCVNPSHRVHPFACVKISYNSMMHDPNPCQHAPIELYDVSVGFGPDIEGVEGFLLVANA